MHAYAFVLYISYMRQGAGVTRCEVLWAGVWMCVGLRVRGCARVLTRGVPGAVRCWDVGGGGGTCGVEPTGARQITVQYTNLPGSSPQQSEPVPVG